MRRLQDTSKATKARQDKHGQHKLGQGGYGRLKARIVSAYSFQIGGANTTLPLQES